MTTASPTPSTPLASKVAAVAANPSPKPDFVQRLVADVQALEQKAASLWKGHQVLVVAVGCFVAGQLLAWLAHV